jgi:hypothetical protein
MHHHMFGSKVPPGRLPRLQCRIMATFPVMLEVTVIAKLITYTVTVTVTVTWSRSEPGTPLWGAKRGSWGYYIIVRI